MPWELDPSMSEDCFSDHAHLGVRLRVPVPPPTWLVGQIYSMPIRKELMRRHGYCAGMPELLPYQIVIFWNSRPIALAFAPELKHLFQGQVEPWFSINHQPRVKSQPNYSEPTWRLCIFRALQICFREANLIFRACLCRCLYIKYANLSLSFMCLQTH